MKSEVLSVKEKIGYGMGDAASHIIFDNVMLYMMFFYTDIFGIPAGFVGTMFLVARALDAISDPCMGLLADRTRSRWGKFRPWVLFGALPFGIVCVLAYSTPDLSMNGKMIYAGKYNAPDYELILDEGCGLAIESTMIHHNPEVEEKLEQFGIPVMVERSSYESHPLGRTEWMKLYAVLLGKEDVAEKAFKEQTDKLDKVLTSDDKDTGKTVAFFYINSTGAVNVRKNGDYVSNMIELAGGKYVPEDTGESDNALSTMNMQMEEFYAKAKDADYIIYNSTIDGELSTIDELLAKSNLLADFKAVKDGNVWCTGKNLFQETTGLGTMIEDIHTMLTTDDDSLDNLTYMHKLK